ncbi:hypothetical protein RYH80_17165 [Halobaculum sp. MBLA0147]|uniref:hypothetical protein n=1 Tax=Halobaculum sp. MBLA0147 TaxID=3079934 RepID=UPI003524A811
MTTSTPGYFTTTETTRSEPETLVEGRLFLTDTELVCGAGTGPVTSGYAGAVDDHAGSTLRRLFGGRLDPQQFSLDDARSRERTVVVPFAAVDDVASVSWSGSDLSGTDQTFAVRVETSRVDGSLLLQLGHGTRNRGSGRERHDRLRTLLAVSADASRTGRE